ncbi:MAG: phosphatase [Candidatus Saganbacteria bacterium]|nr:phosphatase [Candidatus Saganbacteria bacterium]
MKLIADLHIHTVSSGHAYNTIYEYAAKAKKKGLKYIGMTDHGPAMGGAPHPYHFANLHSLPEKINGVRVLKGIEANIMDSEGNLDLAHEFLKDLELVIVSFHINLGYDGSDKKKNTEALIKAVRNPKVNMIGHPGNPQFETDIEAVVEECKKNGVLIEINNSSFSGIIRQGSWEPCIRFAKAVKKIGWKVCFSSDAHCLAHLAEFDKAVQLAKEAGLNLQDIVNTSEKMIEKFVLGKQQN